MSTHLNPQQINDWLKAVEAVEQVAANTDHEAASKPYLDQMAEYVREAPDDVVRLLAVV